jgi:3-hydroxyacyl-CoA dehydrogenase/enoyl-CoA hydratase/carnithine racemase
MMKQDFTTLNVQIHDEIAVLVMNNPPVNQLSEDFVGEISEAISIAFQDSAVKAIVLMGTGKNFIAGADLKEIYHSTEKGPLRRKVKTAAEFLHHVELGPKPVIAGINGNALGGGLEIALACHYRVAAQGAKLGLPEVQVGLIPGTGGTQRLPRLTGLPNALEMILRGNSIVAEKALPMRLVDEVVEPEKLRDAAMAAAHRFVHGELLLNARRTRYKHLRLPSIGERKAVTNGARETFPAKARVNMARAHAIEAMAKGLTFDIETDIDREVDLFCECALSHEAKSLIGTFLNARSAGKLPRIEGIEPAKIKRVVMLGGGVMGSGIVHLLLTGGYDTILWDIDDHALEKDLVSLRNTFSYLVKKKIMTPDRLESMIEKQLSTTTSLEEAKDADLVIEAVPENMKIKQGVWQELDQVCRTDTIFATNTSALPITEMTSVLRDPSRMIGMHFFNPAQRMQLLEIICAKQTSNNTLATSVAFASAINKIPIVVNDGPGFYVTRQLIALLGGSIYLVADGVSLQQIENAVKQFGMPMGPAELDDLTGIDIGYHVNHTFEQELGARYKIHPLTELIYKTGCYGRKTGSGYMDYTGERVVPNKKVVDVVQKYLSDKGISPREIGDQEIIDTLLALAINEAALMTEQGICDRPQDMDLAMVYGAGFPAYRGGVLRYADAWGLAPVYQKLVELEKRYGLRFKPAALIEDMAKAGKTFYQE